MSSSTGMASKGTPVSGAAVKMKFMSDGDVKGKGITIPEVKKVDGSGNTVSMVKQIMANVAAKSEGKTLAGSSKFVTKNDQRVAKGRSQKKIYSLHGQKYDPPEEREPLWIFYEPLSKQIPSSQMAEFWMMEHGLLSPERAKKAYERKQSRQQQLWTGTPIKFAKVEKLES